MASSEIPDAVLLKNLLRDLRLEPRLEDSEITIEVNSGEVRLTGCVESFAKKLVARDIANGVAGVKSVLDDLRVAVADLFERPDEALGRAVREALAWDVFLPEDRIRCAARDGWVVLEGDVDTLRDREDAERLVRTLWGVQGVINHLTLAGQPDADLRELRSRIEESLKHHAEEEAAAIQVAISGGKIVVTGTVHCPREREEILSSLRLAPDWRAVEPSILVES